MNQLRLLGDVDLRGSDGRRIDSILSQPKRLALLAVLALSHGGRLQRDELIGLFWPELPEARARRALSQALHYLRRSLGPNVIDGKYETGIGLSGVACDVCEVLEAVHDGRHADALEMYSGELLPGYHVDGAPPELERWLSAQRTRVRSVVAESAWMVADEAVQAGDAILAGNVARRAYDLSPWGEPAVHRLLTLLLTIGDRAGAMRAYDAFAEELRTEYGGEPSAATKALLTRADTAAREDAREAPVAAAPDSPSETPAEVPPVPAGVPAAPASPPWSRTWRSVRSERWVGPRPAVGTALLILAVLFPALWLSSAWGSEGVPASVESAPELPTLYLESVRDLGFPDPSPGIAEAVTVEVAARLADAGGYQVVTEGSRVRNPHGLRLRSTLQRDGDRLHLAMLLVDPASETVLDRIVVETEEPVGIETPRHLAEALSVSLRRQVGNHLYLSRLAARGVDGRVLSALRSGAAEAAVGDSLGRAGSRAAALVAYRSADSLFTRAQRWAPDWPEPAIRRAELGLRVQWLHLFPPHHDRAAARAVLVEGVEGIDEVLADFPSNADALEVRGVLRYWSGLLAGPGEERRALWAGARTDLQTSVETDASRARAWSVLSAMAERRGDFTDAYFNSRRAYLADRDLRHSSEILVRLFTSALEIGDTDGAARWCAESHQRLPEHWLGTYCDLSRLAWVGPWSGATADSILDAVESQVPSGPAGDDVLTRMKLLHAVVLARGGDRVGAEAAMAAAETTRWPSPEVLALQAWTRATLGQVGEAREALREVVDKHPDAAPGILRSRRYDQTLTFVAAQSRY